MFYKDWHLKKHSIFFIPEIAASNKFIPDFDCL